MVQNSYTSSETINILHKSLNTLSLNYLISIEWVPGHDGHFGNESAVKLVNIRTTAHNPELAQNHPFTPNATFNNRIHDHIKDKFKKRRETCDISQNTKQFVAGIVDRQLQEQHHFKLGSELLRPLRRLIMGHNNLNHLKIKLTSHL